MTEVLLLGRDDFKAVCDELEMERVLTVPVAANNCPRSSGSSFVGGDVGGGVGDLKGGGIGVDLGDVEIKGAGAKGVFVNGVAGNCRSGVMNGESGVIGCWFGVGNVGVASKGIEGWGCIFVVVVVLGCVGIVC